ncbi:gastric triacylglycerol lipase-like [Macrosteles quadrilineatus]|uniref:gastric triacylglycerol lipase-like n=1 Tax=Macrosteles quadrilineatus TaxID=74068 RepID=UPI0023E23D20|nr:gastric triacylglycerol lipase-like [Macrosteles quadrilineatus]
MGVVKVTFLIVCLCMFVTVTKSYSASKSDKTKISVGKTAEQLNARLEKTVTKWGYTLKTYLVETDDHYYLTLHRLMLKEEKPKLSAIFIMDGITGCSPLSIANRKSLAYHLVDKGYDVWLGNARGTFLCMRHRNMKPSEKKFWDFSFHEIGTHDLPAFLTRVKRETGVARVHYVGYSMGTTDFLVLASTQASVVENDVASVTLIAPVACPMHYRLISNRFKRFFAKIYLKVNGALFRGDVFTLHKHVALASYHACKTMFLSWLCERLLRFRSNGRDLYDHLNSLEALPYFPCGASVKAFLHFIQLAEAERFQHYDYGPETNVVKYGQPEPLAYDLGAIEKELYLLVGGQDSEADKRDIQWMHERLKNSYYVDEPFIQFDHRDFAFGTEINKASEVVIEIVEAYDAGRETEIKKTTRSKSMHRQNS